MLTITNAKIIMPDHILEPGAVSIADGRIVNISDRPSMSRVSGEQLDAEGLYLAPGFIDIHVHGGGGADFMDSTVEAFLRIAETHIQYGTTAMLPTTLTSSTSDLIALFSTYEEAMRINDRGARFLGLHLEGPYFAMNQRGAQDPRYIRAPDPQEYEPILAQYHQLIARWSAAPELPGALEFGQKVRMYGILLALAHTDAIYEEILPAVDSGYRLATHLYSGMSGMTRRNAYRYAGTIESCLLLDAIDVEIIADGVHLPEPFLKLIHKVKGTSKTILITDAMRAAGMPAGDSILGSLKNGIEVIVEDGVAKLPDRSSFAGSVATADRLIRTMINQGGASLVEAVQMMTVNPARVLGRDHEIGSIAVGKTADLVLFDENIQIQSAFVSGEIRYQR
ncbi:N-acetylglucosamine-6-phosphate deacetylase [Sphingobacterium sp. InxBP1]|uniref:N-acetylglucosamine-6-phosphate deacetylase n=1 Tax=Sphingobacterium sp. InxBP1 TaxID=2870328 RepID=UPI002243ACAD|nr:N-acetylglucosamine-6-phosphate deacetylase [Sphingobacterium sp. InxBP1]MCW8313396.1 N-acetylglucosamine-6-phosphate deacetylase [Sphingobacterium sp. InxBP1]